MFFAVAPVIGQTVHGALPNQDLSLQYTRLARQSAEAGNFDLSESFTETALVFWQHNPDALYIRAQAMQQHREYEQAIDLLASALSSAEFQYYSKNRVLLEYLDLLVRFDHSREALVVLQNLPPATRRQQDFLRLACRALRIEGRTDQLLRLVRTGIELYPSAAFFQQQMIRLDDAYQRRARQEILGGANADYYSKEAYQPLIAATSTPAVLARLLNAYTSRWGTDLFSRIQGLRLNDELSKNELDMLFAEHTQLSTTELEMLMNITAVFDASAELESAFKSFTGTITRDTDGDGEVEVHEEYSQGGIVKVAENRDGDPGYERKVQFENGAPVWFEIQLEANNSMKMYYQRYPELARAENALGGSLINMDLVPYSVRYPLPEWERYSAPEPVPLPHIETVPSISTLLASSAEIHAEERDVMYGFSRDEGRIETVRNSNTTVLADILRGTLNERRRDSDGDGYFEITEYYREGRLVRISYDGNKNGTPEYVEEYEGQPVRMWDTDEDGIIEYRMQLK